MASLIVMMSVREAPDLFLVQFLELRANKVFQELIYIYRLFQLFRLLHPRTSIIVIHFYL